MRVGDAEHGRERDALLGAQPARRDLGHDLAAERRIVERAGEAERVDVGAALGHEVELDRARRHARAERASPSASSAGWKSLSARKPTTQTGAPSRRSPPAIVSGTSAEGRGTPTAVGSSRFSSSPPV